MVNVALFRKISVGSDMLLHLDPVGFAQNYQAISLGIGLLCNACRFDSEWYSKAYPDVAVSVDAGIYRSSQEHFQKEGFLSGRLGAPMSVDQGWYMDFYPDIGSAVADGSMSSASHHFNNYGWFEGRAAGPRHLINDTWYNENYPTASIEVDLGLYQSAQDHYNRVGYGLGYIASNKFIEGARNIMF